jgi:hypothetical protein
MGTCQSKSPLTMNAGCLFTDHRHVLAGFQPHKPKKIISGFGGKGQEGETPFQTAWRETLEELFELPSPTIQQLIDEIMHMIPYEQAYLNGNYSIFVYSFQNLLELLRICETRHIQSPLYDTFPTELFELILYRNPKPTSEVQQITLLPAVMTTQLDPYFLQDIRVFLNGL